MSLEEMILRGELVREPARPGETRRLIAAATRRLEDAANTSIHPETRLEQAYHAILNCASAVAVNRRTSRACACNARDVGSMKTLLTRM